MCTVYIVIVVLHPPVICINIIYIYIYIHRIVDDSWCVSSHWAFFISHSISIKIDLYLECIWTTFGMALIPLPWHPAAHAHDALRSPRRPGRCNAVQGDDDFNGSSVESRHPKFGRLVWLVPDGSRWFQIELELLNWRATLMVWSCSFNTKYCNPDLSFLFHYIILHPNYLIDRSEYSGNILGVWICELPTANIPSLAVANDH